MSTDVHPEVLMHAIPNDRFAGVHQVLADAIADRTFPGCAYGVFASGTVAVQEALGRQTYEDDAPAILPHTAFDIASLTKVVATTATAMLLHQRGILDLDTPLGELLPAFVVGRPSEQHARYVTVRHLLAHNSGLPGYVELFRAETTPESMLRACLQLPLESEPGQHAEYSDMGFLLLGKALEVLTREPLASWSRREVFEPLEMSATLFTPPHDLSSSIPPTEEDTDLRHRRIQGEVQDENAWRMKGVAGHAGLFSNVPDLLAFAGSLLSAFSSENDAQRRRLFSRNTIEVFAERQSPLGSVRALGWDTPSDPSSAGRHFSTHSIGHLGYSGCSLWIDLDARLAAVLLTNRTWPDRKSQKIRDLRPAFHDAVREALGK